MEKLIYTFAVFYFSSLFLETMISEFISIIVIMIPMISRYDIHNYTLQKQVKKCKQKYHQTASQKLAPK